MATTGLALLPNQEILDEKAIIEVCPPYEILSAMVGKPQAQTLKKLISRFFSKIERQESGCWIWKAKTNLAGYGLFSLNNRCVLAHRLSFFMRYGREYIERKQNIDGLIVLHRCDNPPCVNPDHLILGTVKENNQDMYRKGRGNGGGLKGMNRGSKNGMVILTADQVLEIRKLCDKAELSQREIGELFGVKPGAVSDIHRRVNWGWL